MLKSMLLACCKLYISEGCNASALKSIEHAAQLHPEVVIINRFVDEIYNRTGYTLVSHIGTTDSSAAEVAVPLKKAVFGMVNAAFGAINLGMQSGTHPRLGVVDHICFHPLAHATLDQVAGIAKSVAAAIGRELQVPTFLYGAAHGNGRTLDSIRRELSYFKPNSAGSRWTGGLQLNLQPDEGPKESAQSKGVIVIGATGWVTNYNVPVYSSDMEAVRRVARRVSGRGGGLSSVQAMGLWHGEGLVEVACNLLEPGTVGTDQVQALVQQIAEEEGLSTGTGYCTDFSEEEIVKLYWKSVESV